MTVTCWICNEHSECPYDCAQQLEQSKKLREEYEAEQETSSRTKNKQPRTSDLT